jgi:hypothetical protein
LCMPHPTSCTLFTKKRFIKGSTSKKRFIKGVISWFQTSEQSIRSRLLLSLKNSQFSLQHTRRRRPTLSARRRFLQRTRRPTFSVRRRSTSLPPRRFLASPSAPREDLPAPLPAARPGRQGVGLTAPAGPRRTVHRPRPYSARTRVDGLSWPSPHIRTVADTHPRSVPPPPSRLRLPLPRAVLTPICTSIRVTGKWPVTRSFFFRRGMRD